MKLVKDREYNKLFRIYKPSSRSSPAAAGLLRSHIVLKLSRD